FSIGKVPPPQVRVASGDSTIRINAYVSCDASSPPKSWRCGPWNSSRGRQIAKGQARSPLPGRWLGHSFSFRFSFTELLAARSYPCSARCRKNYIASEDLLRRLIRACSEEHFYGFGRREKRLTKDMYSWRVFQYTADEFERKRDSRNSSNR